MEKARIERITGRFDDVRIIVLGDIMLDRYVWGRVERISPEAPVPVVSVREETIMPGGAANVAASVAALGAKTLLIGLVGEDSYGDQFRTILESNALGGAGLLTAPERPTTVKTRIVGGNQQIVRIDREVTDEIDAPLVAKILKLVEEGIDGIDGIIISDYGKGVVTLDLLSKLIPLANEASKFVAVDPKEVHFKNYKNVSVITPNHHEAGFVSGRRITSDSILDQVGRQLLNELNLESLLITRGEKGMTLFEKDGGRTAIPAEAKTVYDVTGAGDTVIAALTVARTAGASMKEAAFISNVAAGLAVGRFGTARITRDELIEALDNRK